MLTEFIVSCANPTCSSNAHVWLPESTVQRVAFIATLIRDHGWRRIEGDLHCSRCVKNFA
jgi:hypothetical protein